MSLDEGCRKYRTDSRSTSSTAAVCCSIDSPRSCGRPLTIGRLTNPRQNATFLARRPVEQMVEQRIAYERTGVGTQRGGNLVFGEIVQYRPQRQARPVRGRTFRSIGRRGGITLSASGLAASMRFVAHRSSRMPREVRLSPVAMTMSGLACSMASSSVGQALRSSPEA